MLHKSVSNPLFSWKLYITRACESNLCVEWVDGLAEQRKFLLCCRIVDANVPKLYWWCNNIRSRSAPVLLSSPASGSESNLNRWKNFPVDSLQSENRSGVGCWRPWKFRGRNYRFSSWTQQNPNLRQTLLIFFGIFSKATRTVFTRQTFCFAEHSIDVIYGWRNEVNIGTLIGFRNFRTM